MTAESKAKTARCLVLIAFSIGAAAKELILYKKTLDYLNFPVIINM
jgi:hypothetical protein